MTNIQMRLGATETEIQNAINSLRDGGTITLAKGDTVSIKVGLVINAAARDVTLDLNGATLKQEANVAVIRGTGANDVPRDIALSLNADGNTVATYSTALQSIKVGDWVKLVSDDQLPGDRLDDGVTPTRLGQALQVTAINGNSVVFDGKLEYQNLYVTNVRASEINSGAITVTNGTIVGDQAKMWSQPLVQLRNVIDARVEDMTIRDGSSRAINIVNGVNTVIEDVVVKNMANSGWMTGTAVHSVSSTGTTVIGLYAEKVNHATDNNSIGVAVRAADVALYGADIGMKVLNSVAYNTTNFAFTWHSEGLKGTISNVAAIESFGFLMGRGISNTLTDSVGVANTRGVMLFEHGVRDSRGLVIDNITVKETQTYSVFVSGKPRDNVIIDSEMTSSQGNGAIDPLAVQLQGTTIGRTTGSLNEVVTSGARAEMMAGGAGADTMSGGGGADSMIGGLGADLLTGGEGRDRFVYHRMEEAGDTITDFTTGSKGDFLDLSVLASRLGWVRDVAAQIANGFISFVQSGLNTLLRIDVDGGGDNFQTLTTLRNTQADQVKADQVLLKMSETSIGSKDADADQPGGDTSSPVIPTDPSPVVTDVIRPPTIAATPAPPATLSLVGGTGNDFFMGQAGAQTYDGRLGIDRVDYATANSGLVIDMANASAATGLAAGDIYLSVENIVGSRFNDTMRGDGADNLLYGANGDDLIQGGAGNDRLRGDGGNDTLDGGLGNDELRGGDGDDIMAGGIGADTMIGGSGFDTASYADAKAAVSVSLANDIKSWLGTDEAAGDHFASVEAVFGSIFDDALTGDLRSNRLDGGKGNDTLKGGGGMDTLVGGDGNDVIFGGDGRDVLTGGGGHDVFFFGAATTFGDRITDFATGIDTLAFVAADLGISAATPFDFISSEAPRVQNTNATFMLNSKTGLLTFDADGTGAGRAVAVAFFEPNTTLANSDFLLI